MPFVSIKVIEGVFTQEQKQPMIDRVTDAMLSVEGENMRPVTWVVVDDTVKSGDWGIGGQGVTVDMVHAIQQGRAPAPSVA